MKEITVKTYQFNELSDEAKEVAKNWFRESLFDYDWHRFIYEDAENIGLKITSFDCYKNNITGDFIEHAEKVAELIVENHGDKCDTYKDAIDFQVELTSLPEPADNEAHEVWESKMEGLKEDFKHNLLQDYLSMLKKEFEYMESDEYAIEVIEANEYDFLENGKRACF